MTIDAEYHVVSLLTQPDLQLVTDDGHSLAWYDSRAFMTVDGTVPENWEARIGDGGVLKFEPTSWLVPGFRENYHDGDPEAAEADKEELVKIIGSQPDPGMPDLNGPMTSLELQAAAEQVAAARGTDRWKGLMLVLLHYVKDLPAPPEPGTTMRPLTSMTSIEEEALARSAPTSLMCPSSIRMSAMGSTPIESSMDDCRTLE